MLRAERPCLVDVGFGVSAITTFEWATRFPGCRVIGLELDADRVALARQTFPSLEVRHGDLDVLEDGSAAVVRIANVARGLTKADGERLHERVGRVLIDGGVCLEGSTDVEGHQACFFVLRKRANAVVKEALVFETNGARGFSPWMFRDVLPRALRREATPGTKVHQLFTEWAAEWDACRGPDALASFTSSAARLAERRRDVMIDDGLVRWALAEVPSGALSSTSPSRE